MKAIDVSGEELGLPLVGHIGVIRSHKAEQILWHGHDGYELIFLLDGATAYEFKGKDSIRLSGGMMLVVPPGLKHRGAGDVRSPSTIFGIECNPSRRGASRFTPFTAKYLSWMDLMLRNSAVTVRPFGRDLRQSVVKLSRITEQYADGRSDLRAQAVIRALSCSVLAEAIESLDSVRNLGPQEIITAATRFLEKNFHEPVRMDDLVKHLGFSRARVFELFKEHTGMTPNDYLLRYRIQRAQQTLADETKTITYTALASGFSSSQYFSQVFQKYTGKTPSQYRASLR